MGIMKNFLKRHNNYSFWKTFIEYNLYVNFTVFLICTVKLAAYLPRIFTGRVLFDDRYPSVDNISYLIPLEEERAITSINGVSIDYNMRSTSNNLFLSELGIGYPPFLYSLTIILITGLLLKTYFHEEKGMMELWKKLAISIFTLFGVLVTLFSIWGI